METRHWASTFSFHDLGRGRSGIIDTTQSGSFGKYFLKCQIGQVCIIGKPSTGWKGPTSCTFENGGKSWMTSHTACRSWQSEEYDLRTGYSGDVWRIAKGFRMDTFWSLEAVFVLRFKVRLDQCTLQSLCGAYESGVFRENLAKSEAPSKDFPPKRPVATFPAVSARISVDHACVLEVWKPTARAAAQIGSARVLQGALLAEWDLVNPRCLPQAIWRPVLRFWHTNSWQESSKKRGKFLPRFRKKVAYREIAELRNFRRLEVRKVRFCD